MPTEPSICVGMPSVERRNLKWTNRLHQAVLIASLLPLCWLLMMAVHELGHVLAAVTSGGSVSKVVLHPFEISRTDLSDNPHPLWVVWAGPGLGVLLPVAVHVLFRTASLRWWYLVQFFTGFCLIANGAYVGIGSFDGIGDCREMLALGTPIGCLWAFGVVAVTTGLCLWNGLGPEFGLGKQGDEVDPGAAYFTCGLLVVTLVLEFACSPG